MNLTGQGEPTFPIPRLKEVLSSEERNAVNAPVNARSLYPNLNKKAPITFNAHLHHPPVPSYTLPVLLSWPRSASPITPSLTCLARFPFRSSYLNCTSSLPTFFSPSLHPLTTLPYPRSPPFPFPSNYLEEFHILSITFFWKYFVARFPTGLVLFSLTSNSKKIPFQIENCLPSRIREKAPLRRTQ